ENLIVVTPAKQTGFLEFETITLCPLDRRLIDKTLLNAGEIDWVDRYHRAVYRQLHPHLSPITKSWLETACRRL
ncbi:MAG: M24 family metallopeptidase C-terminal domain-containing protein, partial [Candidatus Puniceispirillaceae bacterium]